METDEFVLEFRDSSDDEEEQPIGKKRKFDQEDCNDSTLLIMGPGFGNDILNFLNPEDELKLKTSRKSSISRHSCDSKLPHCSKRQTDGYRIPRKRGTVTSMQNNLPSFVNKCVSEGPVIEMVHSMHRNQVNIPADRSSLVDDDASTVSSHSTASSSAPNTDDNLFSFLREGFESDKNQSSPFLFSNTLALFANASATCESFATKTYQRQEKVNNVAIRKLRITSKDRVNAIKQRNRQLRKENQILVQQVGLLASELQIKLPSVLKEFPQLEEETNTPEESNQSNDGNLNEPYDNPPSNSQISTTPASVPKRRNLREETANRIANQNIEIFRTNESLQTLIDKLYELQNSKNL